MGILIPRAVLCEFREFFRRLEEIALRAGCVLSGRHLPETGYVSGRPCNKPATRCVHSITSQMAQRTLMPSSIDTVSSHATISKYRIIKYQ